MFSAFQSRSQGIRRERPRAFVVIALVCVALLALLTVAQIAHNHDVSTDADHCPLCIVMHSAAPVVTAAALIALVQISRTTPAVEVRSASRYWHAQLFIRPPPAGC